MSKNEFEQRIAKTEIESKRVFDVIRKTRFPFNDTYRLQESDDFKNALIAAENAGAQNSHVLEWYARGPECRDRPTTLATFHPLIHKREWKRIHASAQALAIELGRWIWLTIGEDRWARILIGDDPMTVQPKFNPQLDAKGRYQNDQYLTCFSPTGKEQVIGAS